MKNKGRRVPLASAAMRMAEGVATTATLDSQSPAAADVTRIIFNGFRFHQRGHDRGT
jgi:hypothetical protein